MALEAGRRTREAGFDALFTAGDLCRLRPEEAAADLVVCCEALEHVPDPGAALEALARLARPHLLVSVPREPIWRALNMLRGKYLTELGNTPGHLQHWSAGAFVEFLSCRFEVLQVRTPLPWTMALCRVRAGEQPGLPRTTE